MLCLFTKNVLALEGTTVIFYSCMGSMLGGQIAGLTH